MATIQRTPMPTAAFFTASAHRTIFTNSYWRRP